MVVAYSAVSPATLSPTVGTIARTRALDFLAAKGYIERRAGQGDAREKAVFPTAKADAIHAALNAASGAVTARLRSLLGDGEFTQMVSKMNGVRSALQ